MLSPQSRESPIRVTVISRPTEARSAQTLNNDNATSTIRNHGTGDTRFATVNRRLRNLTLNTAIANMTAFYREHCIYFPAMAGWFLFSALLSSYNKLVFGSDHLHFPCPLLLTSMHFGTQWFVSSLLCAYSPTYWGGHDLAVMSWKQWALLSIPCGLVTSGDVGMSNLSLVHISITFYTMVKASTPIFVLGWAYALGIERITLPLIGVILWIAMGEFLTVSGEVEFNMLGFLLCLGASVLSGARWTLVQSQLQSLDPPLKTTVATMKLLAPSMFFSMLILSFVIESPTVKLADYDQAQLLHVVGMGLSGAFVAICMILCEFYLIMHASAMILMVGGVLKELLTIAVGFYYFGDDLNGVNMAGCFLVFLGVLFYKVIFHMQKHSEDDDNNNTRSPASGARYQVLDRNVDETDGDMEANSVALSSSTVSDTAESTGSVPRSPRDERVGFRKNTTNNGADPIVRSSEHSDGSHLLEMRNGTLIVKAG